MSTSPAVMPSPTEHPVDLLAGWRSGVRVGPATGLTGRHTIHSYFNTCPESPDGRHILYYTSWTPEGEEGDLRVLERATGRERIVARNVRVEDAHRTACQQWVKNGQAIVFHDFREERWVVLCVDLKTGTEKILAYDRQLGFGSAARDWVPLYGCHWNPGDHCDLELVNVDTGEIRIAVTVDQVVKEYPEWVQKEFGGGKLSIFFPVASPDGRRVMFKMAKGNGGKNFRDPAASRREGRIIFDLEGGRLLRLFAFWGHPSWHPDSQRILDKGNILYDSQTGVEEACLPAGPSDHASFSPRGDVFVTDGKVLTADGRKLDEWGVFVADPVAHQYVIVHRFANDKGAKTWRHNHPHPVFSSDGRRLYFNVNAGEWTQLFVAEIGTPEIAGQTQA